MIILPCAGVVWRLALGSCVIRRGDALAGQAVARDNLGYAG